MEPAFLHFKWQGTNAELQAARQELANYATGYVLRGKIDGPDAAVIAYHAGTNSSAGTIEKNVSSVEDMIGHLDAYEAGEFDDELKGMTPHA